MEQFIHFLSDHRATLRTLVLADVFIERFVFGVLYTSSLRVIKNENRVRVLSAIPEVQVLELHNALLTPDLSETDIDKLFELLPSLRSFRYNFIESPIRQIVCIDVEHDYPEMSSYSLYRDANHSVSAVERSAASDALKRALVANKIWRVRLSFWATACNCGEIPTK